LNVLAVVSCYIFESFYDFFFNLIVFHRQLFFDDFNLIFFHSPLLLFKFCLFFLDLFFLGIQLINKFNFCAERLIIFLKLLFLMQVLTDS